jgi:hypothetical protein
MNVLVEGNRSYPLISDLVKLDPINKGEVSEERLRLAIVPGEKTKHPKDSQFNKLANAVIKTTMEVKEQTNGATYGWIESIECEYYQIEEGGPLSLCLVVCSDPNLDETTQQQLHQALSDEISAAIEAEDCENYDHRASASRLHNATRGALKHFRKLREHSEFTVQRAVVDDDGEGGRKAKMVTSSTPLRKKNPPTKTSSSFDGLTKIVAINDDRLEVTFRDVSGDAETAHPDMRMKAKNEKQFKNLNVAKAHGILLTAKFDYKAEGQEAFGTLKKGSVDFSPMNGKRISITVEEGGYPIVTLSDLPDAGNDDALHKDVG